MKKLQRGLELLAKAGDDQDLLGLSLISIHGALEDHFRNILANNYRLSVQERETVRNVKEMGWKPLVDMMKKYGGLSNADANYILGMNNLRQGVSHGGAFTGDRRDLENYAKYVQKTLGLTVASTSPEQNLKNYPSTVASTSPEQNLKNYPPEALNALSPTDTVRKTSKPDFWEILFGWVATKLLAIIVAVIWVLIVSVAAALLIYFFRFSGVKNHENLINYLVFITIFLASGKRQIDYRQKNFYYKTFNYWWLTCLAGGWLFTFLSINRNHPFFKGLNTFFIKGENPFNIQIYLGGSKDFSSFLIGGCLIGIFVGVLQWLILKKATQKTFWWIIANGLEMPAIWFGTTAILGSVNKGPKLLPFLTSIDPVTKWLMLIFGWPTLCSIITGVALGYIFTREKN